MILFKSRKILKNLLNYMIKNKILNIRTRIKNLKVSKNNIN